MSSPISGFTAIPNPQMLAFMPIQSYLMMYFAGSGWQYGKRKISAMSNEQFNKLTPEELLQQHSIELKNMLPTLSKTLNDVTPLVSLLIEQYGDFIVEALKVTPKVVSQVSGEVSKFVKQELVGEDSLFAWLKLQFPSLPSAEARRGASGLANAINSSQPLPRSSRIPGVSVSQLQQEARDKQLAFERQQRLRRADIANKTFVPVVSPTAPISGGKQRAGQSQIMERAMLIKEISTAGFNFKNNRLQRDKNRWWGILTDLQQRLVNLLDRYRFN